MAYYDVSVLWVVPDMASTWLRMKLHYIGGIKLSKCFTPFVLFSIVYIVYRLTRGSSLGIVRQSPESFVHRMSPAEISDYLDALQDTRPQQCLSQSYPSVRQRTAKVSLLLDFHEDELYDLKLTLTSVIENTPKHLYNEIVVLDDGTSGVELRKHAIGFLKEERFKHVKAFRSEEKHGQSATRYKAARVAEGDILVFLSSSVVVNKGWLEPLLEGVLQKDDRIVVPHADSFLSDKRFYKTDNNLVSVFTWPLATVYMESTDSNPIMVKSPAMRGHALAVNKDFLLSIGNYDEAMDDRGGHHLELSLRTWMCGGEIRVALCSRVAVPAGFRPEEVVSQANVKRITGLWLTDYRDIVEKQTTANLKMTEDEKSALQLRQHYFRDHVGACRPFSWYLSSVVPEVFAPSQKMVFYGKLEAMTSYCARAVADDRREVDAVLCRPWLYEPNLVFELNERGQIQTGDRCLCPDSAGGRAELVPCQQVRSDQQQWVFTHSGKIQNEHSKLCLSHESESGGHGKQHYLALRQCTQDDDRRQQWKFLNY